MITAASSIHRHMIVYLWDIIYTYIIKKKKNISRGIFTLEFFSVNSDYSIRPAIMQKIMEMFEAFGRGE